MEVLTWAQRRNTTPSVRTRSLIDAYFESSSLVLYEWLLQSIRVHCRFVPLSTNLTAGISAVKSSSALLHKKMHITSLQNNLKILGSKQQKWCCRSKMQWTWTLHIIQEFKELQCFISSKNSFLLKPNSNTKKHKCDHKVKFNWNRRDVFPHVVPMCVCVCVCHTHTHRTCKYKDETVTFQLPAPTAWLTVKH